MLKQKILKKDASYNCSNKTRSIINSNPTLSQSVRVRRHICIPITLNNPLKACTSNNKYLITIKTRTTQILKVYFLL